MSACAIKSCLEIWREHNRAWSKLYDDYQADMTEARAREFPIGAKVKWPANGSCRVSGTVVGHPRFSPDRVTVKNSKSGASYDKEIKELEHES